MEKHAAVIRALAMRVKGARLKADGAALGDEGLKAEGRRWEEAGRVARAESRAARR